MDKAVLANQIKEALAAHEGWKMKLRAGIEGAHCPSLRKILPWTTNVPLGSG